MSSKVLFCILVEKLKSAIRCYSDQELESPVSTTDGLVSIPQDKSYVSFSCRLILSENGRKIAAVKNHGKHSWA